MEILGSHGEGMRKYSKEGRNGRREEGWNGGREEGKGLRINEQVTAIDYWYSVLLETSTKQYRKSLRVVSLKLGSAGYLSNFHLSLVIDCSWCINSPELPMALCRGLECLFSRRKPHTVMTFCSEQSSAGQSRWAAIGFPMMPPFLGPAGLV